MSRTYRQSRFSPHRQPRTKGIRVAEHYAAIKLAVLAHLARKFGRVQKRANLRSAAIPHSYDDLTVLNNEPVRPPKQRFRSRSFRKEKLIYAREEAGDSQS